MRVPAVLLAIPLTVGSAVGLYCGEHAPAMFALAAAAGAGLALLGSLSALAWGHDGTAECTACLIAGAFVVGMSSGADAASRAYRSQIFTWFEARRPAAAPVVLHGVLREDAATTQAGVAIAVDVGAVEPCGVAADHRVGSGIVVRRVVVSGCR